LHTPVESGLLRVVLVSARNPLNIGAAARAMSNFGFAHLRVVNPHDVAFREARSAVGASAVLAGAEEYASVAEAVADCTLVVGTTSGYHRELQHPLRRLEEAAHLIRSELQSGNVALMFGSEKRGLSNEDLSHCHWLLRIPTCEEHISMNLGQAVAVCLYELVREAGGGQPSQEASVASAGDLDRTISLLLDALRISGYLHPDAAASAEKKVRRLIRRLRLPADDVETWLGMLRQMIWKMRSGQESSK
jgi:TrmH family RNA methyltransferase